MKSIRLTTLALAAVCAVSASAQTFQYPSQEYWKRPDVIERFLGTYGQITQVEPKISQDEQELFKKLIEQMQVDRKLALNTLKAAVNENSGPAVLFNLANLQVETGDFANAEANYTKAIKKFPEFLRAYKNLGVVLCQDGKFPEAIEPLSKAINLGANDSLSFGLLGLSFLQTGNYISSEIAYRNAIMAEPGNIEWKKGLAVSLVSQQKFKDAISVLDELIRTKPEEKSLWLTQANAYLGLEEEINAAANLEIVRRMGLLKDKQGAESLLLLGDIYMNNELRDLALEAYLQAMAINPDQPVDRLVRAAEIFVSRGDLTKAEKLLDQIHTSYSDKLKDNDELAVLKLESRIAIAQNQSDKAAAILEKVVERAPLDGEALILLASYYNKKGEIERAELFYDRAAKIKGKEVDALIAHAQMLVGVGDYEKALPLLEKANTLDPRENVQRYIQQVRNAQQSSIF